MRPKFALVVARLGRCQRLGRDLAAALPILWLSQFPVVAEDLPVVVRERLDEADALRAAGKLEEAVLAYDATLRLQPNIIDAYLALGSVHHQLGHLEDAYAVFSTGLDQDRDNTSLLFNSAVVALALKRGEDAIGHSSRLVDLKPRNPRFALLHGSVLSSLNRLEDAIATHETATRLDSKNAQAWLRYGNLFHRAKRREEAVDAFRTALKRDRGLLAAQYNLGAVLFELGRFPEALEAYRVALEPYDRALKAGERVAPSHAQAYSNLGAILAKQQNWPAAQDAYAKAVTLQPDFADAWYANGLALEQAGDDFAALSAFVKALGLDPSLGAAYLHLGRLYAKAGDHAGVVRWLEQGRSYLDDDQAPEALELLELLGGGLAGVGRSADALAAFRELVARDPNNVEALLALGRESRLSGDSARARDFLQRAVDAAPERIEPALELAELARSFGDIESQKAIYLAAIERAEGHAELWRVEINLAFILLAENDIGQARLLVERVVGLLEGERTSSAREFAFVKTLLGYLFIREGQLDNARGELEKALEKEPSYAYAEAGLAVLDALENRFDSSLRRFLDSNWSGAHSSELEAMIKGNRGLVSWLAGRAEEFRIELELVAAENPDWLALQLAVGQLALAREELDIARDYLESAWDSCQAGDSISSSMRLGGALVLSIGDRAEVCEAVAEVLATALANLASQQLASSPAMARRLADRALDISAIRVPDRALARFVRGSSQLVAGQFSTAQRDLAASLGAGLAEEYHSAAHVNLAVAEYGSGDSSAAEQRLKRIRESEPGNAAALLNLAILLEVEHGAGEESLGLYEEYLRRHRTRREEVEGWVQRLSGIYR